MRAPARPHARPATRAASPRRAAAAPASPCTPAGPHLLMRAFRMQATSARLCLFRLAFCISRVVSLLGQSGLASFLQMKQHNGVAAGQVCSIGVGCMLEDCTQQCVLVQHMCAWE